MMMAIAKYFNNKQLHKVEFKEVKVPEQKDCFSCGWRTLIHAEYILQNLYMDNPNINKVENIYYMQFGHC